VFKPRLIRKAEAPPARVVIFSAQGLHIEQEGPTLIITSRLHGRHYEECVRLEGLIENAMKSGWVCDILRSQSGETPGSA
jgi:hypothetical protein